MNKWRIEYREEYKNSPMSYWVHKNLDGASWVWSKKFDPPLPKAIPLKGFPYLVINVLGVELNFSSVQEAEHFLSVISQKNMPTTSRLSRERSESYGPNRHWLSRLPARIKPWSKRQKLIPVLKCGINGFKAAYS